jgi:hypothetical protein
MQHFLKVKNGSERPFLSLRGHVNVADKWHTLPVCA